MTFIPTRGWLNFKLQLEEDAMIFLNNGWMCGKTCLSLKLWNPCFDPRDEPLKKILVCFKVPRISLQFWNDKFLTALENNIENTIYVDPSYKFNVMHTIERVLILVDLKKVFPNVIEIQFRDFTFQQVLDYV